MAALWFAVASAGSAAANTPIESTGGPPHIVFILVDTLRADHLGAYGYERNTSPSIDALAAEGLLFENAYSTAPWTNPAIVTLFTGMHPQSVHPAAPHHRAIRQALPAELTTLAEALRRGGYSTAALIDHPGINARLGYDQGFDVFTRLFKSEAADSWTLTDSRRVFEAMDEQLRAMNPQQPSFVYLHLVYPHRPYEAPAPYHTLFGPSPDRVTRTQREGAINIYDGEIRYTDDLIGRIVERMRALALLEHSIVVVTSDHGEAFWEHGMSQHGNSFYDELIRVPLIIRAPRDHPLQRGRSDGLVSTVDLYPTVLQLARLPVADGIEGRSLFEPTGAVSRPRTIVFSESPHKGDIEAAASVGTGRKYIRTRRWKHELYDLRRDPAERENRIFSTELFDDPFWRLRRRLAEHREHTGQQRRAIESRAVEPDRETQDRLRALGYGN
jgi:arylsulfatase A-like enzyme